MPAGAVPARPASRFQKGSLQFPPGALSFESLGDEVLPGVWGLGFWPPPFNLSA
jgi:hypothetical protein